jgi:opacity protein-like surface antigen
MNKMKYLIPVITMACFSFMPVMAEELQPQYFYGMSLSHVDMLATPRQSEVTSKYVPSIFVGVGYEFDIDKNWQVEWTNSLNFTQANIRPIEISIPDHTALTNVGLWSHVKLEYSGLFDNASPFVKTGVGLINVDYSLNGQSNNSWDTATILQAGIEFELSEGSSIEIAFGVPNYNKF